MGLAKTIPLETKNAKRKKKRGEDKVPYQVIARVARDTPKGCAEKLSTTYIFSTMQETTNPTTAPQWEEVFTSNDPRIEAMHREADRMQAFMDRPATLEDPAALTYRLKDMDAYMSRLTDMMVRSKAMKDYAKNKYLAENEERFSKMTATASNRLIDAHLCDLSVLYTRLEAMSHTIERLARDLVTQISYIKQQINLAP